MNIDQYLTELLNNLPNAAIRQVQVGMIWSIVVVELGGQLQAGVAASLQNPEFERMRQPAVEAAGSLEKHTTRELAGLIRSKSYTEAAIGLAAINALLPRQKENWVDQSAEAYLHKQGKGKHVVVIGHFPFVDRLCDAVGELSVLELDPSGGDLPAEAAPDIVPKADILAITATTLINHTLEGLLALRRPDTKVLLMGPSTPLSTALFNWGIDVLFGTVVKDPLRVAHMVSQGATQRQMKHYLRQVTLLR